MSDPAIGRVGQQIAPIDTTRPAAPQAARTTNPAPTPAPLPMDKVLVAPTAKGAAIASLSLTKSPTIDFRTLLPGFKGGDKIDVGATGLEGLVIGGDGRISAMSANNLKMSLHVTAPGVNKRLNVDLRAENGGYHLVAPEDWNVSVAKVGDWYRLTNLSDTKQYIELKSTGSGEARIRTHGMDGVDGHTLTIEVD